MKLLLVGFPASIHLAKAISMLSELDWDVHVVGSLDLPWHDDFDRCTIHHFSARVTPPVESATRRVVIHQHVHPLNDPLLDRTNSLAQLIDDLRPDIVHSHEFQHSAYLTLAARKRCLQPFPAWIVTSWGSDLYFHGRDVQHRRVIAEILAAVDGYASDCSRDIAIARSEGFRGVAFPVAPVTGGYVVDEARALRVAGPTSSRTAIAVKGYQHQFGRAVTALDALDMCGDLLAGRDLLLHSPSNREVEEVARRLADLHGAQVVVLKDVPNREMLQMYGRARIAVGLSISDGSASSFLEAMLGGAFPIQSFTACATEWVVDGAGALLVDPTDVTAVASAIRRALTDDKLVDSAQPLNDHTIDVRLDRSMIRAATAEGYRRVVARRSDLATSGVRS